MKVSLSTICFVVLGLVLSLPFLLLFAFGIRLNIDSIATVFSAETYEILNITLQQSVLSALLSGGLGLVSVLCLWSMPEKFQSISKNLLLAPSVLPSLFIVVAGGSFFQILGYGLYGFWGVVILHILINVGLVTLGLHLSSKKYQDILQLGRVEGASRWRLRLVWLRLIFPDLLSLMFLVFSFAFTSFSIPVLVGGAKALSFEVYMYQLIKIESNFSAALMVGLLQLLLFLVLTRWVDKHKTASWGVESQDFAFLSLRHFAWVPFFPSILLAIGFIPSFVNGGIELMEKPELVHVIVTSAANTLLQGFLAGLMLIVLVLLSLLLTRSQQNWVRGFMPLGYGLTGIAFIVFPIDGFALLKTSIGLALLFFPFLFRGYLYDANKVLHEQKEVAEVMGASSRSIYKAILLPQLQGSLRVMFLLFSLWVFCDYGLSLFTLSSDANLGVVASNLAGSYRIDLASFITGITCIFALAFYKFADVIFSRWLSCR